MLSIPGIPADGKRDLPDVSIAAATHDSYLACQNQDCANQASPNPTSFAGTSIAAPAFAGIMAIIDQKLGGRQGLANYALYTVAEGENFSACNSSSRTNPAAPPSSACPFNDITLGNNSIPGQAGYAAGTGYDLASGLGSVNASVLANAWSLLPLKPTTTTLSSSSGSSIDILHGYNNFSLNVSVAPRAGSGTPTGTVAIETSTGLAVGLVDLQDNSLSFVTLPGGAYNIAARYSGDNAFAPSVSNSISATVIREPSTVTLGLAAAPATDTFLNTPLPVTLSVPYGSPVVVYLSVAGNSGNGYPSGTVILYNSYGNDQQTTEAIPLNSGGQSQANLCFTPGSGCLTAGVYTFWGS